MNRYLLSTGKTTTQVEYYIIDLFRIYLTVFPKDIPGNSDIGFNFILSDVKESNLPDEIKFRVNTLINTIKNKFTNEVNISINTLEMIDNTRVKLVLDVNKIISDEIIFDILNK